MNKKIWILLLVVIMIIIGVIVYFVISDLGQEEKLVTELDELNTLVNSENVDMNQIEERLDRVVTKGDYATVEKAFKQYLSDSFDNAIRISEILNDEKITQSLTAENYKEDGPDFVATKEYLANTKQELNERKINYEEFFTEEKAMSYINNKGLDEYYISYYRDEIVGDIESANDTSVVESSIDEVISILDTIEEIINLLSDNKDSWQIENDTIVFNTESLSDQYNELIGQFEIS